MTLEDNGQLIAEAPKIPCGLLFSARKTPATPGIVFRQVRAAVSSPWPSLFSQILKPQLAGLGIPPGFLKFLLNKPGGRGITLRLQAFHESEERARIAGILLKVGAKNRSEERRVGKGSGYR